MLSLFLWIIIYMKKVLFYENDYNYGKGYIEFLKSLF